MIKTSKPYKFSDDVIMFLMIGGYLAAPLIGNTQPPDLMVWAALVWAGGKRIAELIGQNLTPG